MLFTLFILQDSGLCRSLTQGPSVLPALNMDEDHTHCTSCVNRRCMVRAEPGISCDLITCPQVCGAVFHSCKTDEHHLLCPLVRVPCLNSGYGCPVVLVRNQMYDHLEVCPAGVVFCTMEWNRWPVSCLDYTSYESLSRGVEKVEQLDMALALQDQRTLLESLKVIAMAPTVEKMSHLPVSKENSTAMDSSLSSSTSGLAKEKIMSGINGLHEEHLGKLYEATVETARTLAAALDYVSSATFVDKSSLGRSRAGGLVAGTQGNSGDHPRGLENPMSGVKPVSLCSGCLSESVVPEETEKTILVSTNGSLSGVIKSTQETPYPVKAQCDTDAGAPEETATPQMISAVPVSPAVAQRAGLVVLDDRGLVSLEIHSSEQSDNSLTSQNWCSLPNGQLDFMPERPLNRLRPEMEDKSVDTSDLWQEDDQMGLGEIDLITAALLFCLEESKESRRISDTIYIDGCRVDFGTQTFTFPAAILVTNTRVGDMASASACDHAAPQLSYPNPFYTLRLSLLLEVEALAHNCYLPSKPRSQHMFPFICGQSFRRDQFSSHFTNVHSDIHAGLNGWMEHRCPLAYYGCTFSQRRFYPSHQEAKVVHDRYLRSFGIQPCPRTPLCGNSQSDQLSGLPIEILWHIASFLDSFSLCQLSLVSRTMRELCASLLQTRGIVELVWERRQGPGNSTLSWQVKKKVS